MKKALVLAGGLGSRLKTYTNSVYPKLLLSLGNETMLDKLIFTWFEVNGVSEMLIVLSEQSYLDMVQKYVNTFHPDKPIKLCLYPKTDGTFRTIFYVLNKHKDYQENVYLTWSDIVPRQYPEIVEDTNFTIFVDNNRVHRYLAYSGDENQSIKYSPSHNGNIMGLYHYDNLDPYEMLDFYDIVSQDDKEIDFVDYLMHIQGPGQIGLRSMNVFDIGDVKKYDGYLENQSVEQRWFNAIEFTDDKVIKSPANAYGEKVMESEKAFYELIQESDAKMAFPTFYPSDKLEIVMDNLCNMGFDTVHKQMKNIKAPEAIKNLIEAYETARKDLNGQTKYETFNKYIYNEYYQVPIERYSKIEYIIPKNITRVNGQPIGDFYEMMDKLLAYLKDVTYNWGLIHGDTNSSNTMYNRVYSMIKFIDPRGTFGGNKYYGDVLYDQAKFMYGLSGYDHFNLDKNFKFEIDGNEIKFDIEGLELDDICDDRHIKILVGLIWLKLPYYIKNNPNKVIASYFHGMYLLTKYLK